MHAMQSKDPNPTWATDARDSTAAPESPTPFLAMKKHVLLAEDDLTVLTMLDEALHFLGYSVVTARDGAEALERMTESRTTGAEFDLVVTDHQMPVLGGLDLVRALRARAFAGRVYVLSGAMAAEARVEYARLGVDGVAMKPLEIRALHRLLRGERTEAEGGAMTWRGR